MTSPRLIPAFIAVLLVGGALGFGITKWMSSEPAANTEGGRKPLYWHDPMVPSQKFDKPGKSPFMDMQLVPVYADDEGGGAQVKVSANASQNLGVRLGKVERAVIETRLSAVGSVTFDEELLELVQARVEGYVAHLHVKTTLAPVRKGQPLVDVVAPSWLAAQEEYLALLDATSSRGTEIRAAARQRLIVLGVPESSIRRLESDRKTTASTTIYSPADGVIAELGVREGSSFMAGAPLFRINSLRKVWAVAQVPEAMVSAVAPGSAVKVRATAWAGEEFNGRVVAILPDVDVATRTLPVRVEIDNPKERLVPGMFASLDFVSPASAPQLLVPSEAVIMTGERSVVIVARDGGFDVVDVKVGAESNGKTAVLSGLNEGQTVVLSGQFLIDSEASLRSTVSRLGPQGAATEPGTAASHMTRGKIVAITPTAVIISHEAVPSLQWGAMTMSFSSPASGLPADLAVGDDVSFAFSDAGNGIFRIDSITKVESPGSTP
jgi:Cu(I)/Ag(I) efflux system membrane fusion protein